MKLHLFQDANIEGFIILLKDTVFGLPEPLTQSSFTKENRTEWCWWLWQLAKQWVGSRDKPKERLGGLQLKPLLRTRWVTQPTRAGCHLRSRQVREAQYRIICQQGVKGVSFGFLEGSAQRSNSSKNI